MRDPALLDGLLAQGVASAAELAEAKTLRFKERMEYLGAAGSSRTGDQS